MGSDFFLNTLTAAQWGLLAAVPPLLVLLYFLKLKRRPLEVPSTFLWRRAIEDLHVNSIWQRLRQNLLLFLQLLFIALLAFALLRPGWQGTKLNDSRLIFMIDTSASMAASDVAPTRLDAAKKECEALIQAMESGAVAMIISFSDTARVEQPFTDNKNVLRTKLKAIKPTQHLSSLEEALRAAAGLANPGRSSTAGDAADVATADAMPATVYILSDGGFRSIPKFSLGNLTPKYVRIGDLAAGNVAITTFTTGRNPEKLSEMQAFARLENFSEQEAKITASLFMNDTLLDAKAVTLPPREKVSPGAAGVQFELESGNDGVLRLEIDAKDHLPLDNTAYSVLNVTRPARVLVVSPGVSNAMRLALSTDEASKVSQITYETPKFMETKPYQDAAAAGSYDLIMYDRCVPPSPPQANTLFIGSIPSFEGWTPSEKQGSPTIIDIDRVHPLTQLVDMNNVLIADSRVVQKPKGGSTLIDADLGPILAIGPRQSFEDAVLGFELVSSAEDGTDKPATDWSRRRSFPVFFMNAIKYLGGTGQHANVTSVRPGEVYPIRTLVPVDRVQVKTPAGENLEVLRESHQSIGFSQTEQPGIYEVREGTGSQLSQRFAVNLFDSRESDLQPAETVEIGHEAVQAEKLAGRESVRKELWKAILLLGLAIVLLEWYIYNRRVYL
jgi:hypothetical protein